MKIEDIKIGKWYFCESFKLLNGSIIGIGENEFMVNIETPDLSNSSPSTHSHPLFAKNLRSNTKITLLTTLVKENDIIKKYIADNEQKYQIGDSITFKKDIEITKRKVRAIGEDVVYFDNSDPKDHFTNKVLGINHIRIHVENILKECQQENVEEKKEI